MLVRVEAMSVVSQLPLLHWWQFAASISSHAKISRCIGLARLSPFIVVSWHLQ